MAINYIAPSPPPQIIQHAYSGGGGGGASAAGYAAQQNNDMEYMRLMQQKAAMSGATGRDLFQADVQMAGIQQHAETAAWLSQQKMTQRDVMDLKNKQNLVSMISNDNSLTAQEKSDSIMQIRTGIDIANKRLADEQIKAQAENRRAMAADHDSKVEMRDNALAFKRAEMDDKLGTYIAPRYKLDLADIMKDAHPELQSGTPQYDAMLTMEADKMGWTQRYTKNAKGEMVFEKDVKGTGSSAGVEGTQTKKGGTELDAAHVNSAYQSARDHVLKLSKEKKDDGTLAHPELQDEAKRMEAVTKEFEAQVAATSGHFNKGKTDAMEGYKQAVGKVDTSLSVLSESQDVSPQAKQYGIGILNQIKTLMAKYPPSKPVPDSIKARIKALQDKFDQYQWQKPDTPKTKITPEMIKTEGGGYEVGLAPWAKNLLERSVPPAGGGGGY